MLHVNTGTLLGSFHLNVEAYMKYEVSPVVGEGVGRRSRRRDSGSRGSSSGCSRRRGRGRSVAKKGALFFRTRRRRCD